MLELLLDGLDFPALEAERLEVGKAPPGLAQLRTQRRGAPVRLDRLGLPPNGLQRIAQPHVADRQAGIELDRPAIGVDGLVVAARAGLDVRKIDVHVGRMWVELQGALDARQCALQVQALELRAAQVDPRGEKIGRDLDRPFQQFLSLTVMLRVHRHQCQQPQRFEIARIASQDLAVDRFGLHETPRAVMLGCLGDQLADRIGVQERLHERVGLICATRLRQCVHQRQLRRLQFRVEIERPAQLLDGLLRPA